MPNGRPGDHPYTDIFVHDIELYSEPIRDRIREVDAYDDPTGGVEWRLDDLLVEYVHPDDEDLDALDGELRTLVAELDAADDLEHASPLAAALDDDPDVYDAETRRQIRTTHETYVTDAGDVGHYRRRELSGALWTVGWTPAATDDVRAALDAYRAEK